MRFRLVSVLVVATAVVLVLPAVALAIAGPTQLSPTPGYSSCKSPKTYKHLRAGKYTFFVRALSGSVAGKAASKSFKIA